MVVLGTLTLELSPARELNSHVFATLPLKTFPKLPKCLRKASQERFGRSLGMLWSSPGRSCATLGALLGSSWAEKLVQKFQRAPKIAEKVSKSAKILCLKATWAQLATSWAHLLSSWSQIWSSRMQIWLNLHGSSYNLGGERMFLQTFPCRLRLALLFCRLPASFLQTSCLLPASCCALLVPRSLPNTFFRAQRKQLARALAETAKS